MDNKASRSSSSVSDSGDSENKSNDSNGSDFYSDSSPVTQESSSKVSDNLLSEPTNEPNEVKIKILSYNLFIRPPGIMNNGNDYKVNC